MIEPEQLKNSTDLDPMYIPNTKPSNVGAHMFGARCNYNGPYAPIYSKDPGPGLKAPAAGNGNGGFAVLGEGTDLLGRLLFAQRNGRGRRLCVDHFGAWAAFSGRRNHQTFNQAGPLGWI